MRVIGKIFCQDLKSISKNLIIFVVVIGITILPALYAWFNIAANWDPYGNTGEIPFAVCSLDKGYTFKSITVNAGDSIIDGLKQNDKMGWDFVDADEAKDGVENGKYYAAVIIPENFSENLLSIATGKFEQAKIDYYVNEKKNAIAPKITDKGVETIQETVDATYVSTIAKTIATTLNITSDELEADKTKIADAITTALNDAKTEVNSLSQTIDLLVTTLDSVDGLIKTNKDMLPTVKQTLESVGVAVGEAETDVKTALTAAKNTSAQVTNTVESIISSADAYADTVSAQLDEAFGTVSSDANALADKLGKVKIVNNKKIEVCNRLISIFESIQTNLGVDCSKVINLLNKDVEKQNAIIAKIDSICNTITTTGAAPANAKAELDALVSEEKTDFSALGAEFSAVKQNIDNAVSKPFVSLDSVAALAQNVSTGENQLETAFDSASTLNGNLKEILKQLKNYLGNLTTKIDNGVKRVDEIKNNDELESLLLPIIEDPEALGAFISDPVASESHRVYPIDNYGSAMTPFYSSLALWVGGVVLVAVMNVDLTENDRKKLGKAKPVQLFFGRYLMFFIAGQIQALIIALGDLYFLKIQCENPLLFIFACLVSSFVYTLFIYALTITFSVVGKALAVIVLIMQVAGSGGTFPIEVLPAPFKVIAPFLPFKYGINALRETVAGVDMGSYWQNLGWLLLFIVPSLVLGLLLRKPCIKIIGFFNEKIEESDLII